MKKVINILLTALLFASVAFKANAQALDMGLGNATISPDPSPFPGTATISFTVVAEILDQPMSSDDLGISYATINIGLSNLQGSALILPTGPGADAFNWQYDAINNTYIGTSKDATLPADLPQSITLTGLPVVASTTANITGFSANLSPPGDLLASETNDDNVFIFTTSPLPVTLVSFDAQSEGQVAVLNWATTEETNSEYFEVQHSLTGKAWAPVGKVASNGESTTLKNYTFSHNTPVNGENLYRLKMVDKDQTFAYSRIQSVKFEGLESDLTVYPNPVTDKLFIRDFAQVSQVNIYDLKGLSVYQSGLSKNSEINVNNLPTGVYTVRITRSNGLQTSQKIVVSK